MENKLPNFLIVGAAKSGTTSLYKYLADHPQVYLSPVKEPLFFVLDSYKNISRNDPRHSVADKKAARMASLEDYLWLFENVSDDHKAIGEASAPYLYHYEMAIRGIKKHLGDPKIIIILRNPIERAFSSYNHLVREGVETSSFEEFLRSEEKRKRENWDVLNYPVDLGMYYEQVKAYKNNFSQVKVILLDDLKSDSLKTIQELCIFLGVSNDFSPDTSVIFNKSDSVRSSYIADLIYSDHFLKTMIKNIFSLLFSRMEMNSLGHRGRKLIVGKPKINAKTRKRLRKEFTTDIEKLQTLIGRDLSHWS